MIYLAIFFFVLAGLFEAVMDVVQFHYHKSIFKKLKNNLFWDASESWKNKYKDGDPNKGPKFFLSNTLFVGLTDAWHLFKTLRTLSVMLGVFTILTMFFTICKSFLITAAFRVFFGISFTSFYNFFQKK